MLFRCEECDRPSELPLCDRCSSENEQDEVNPIIAGYVAGATVAVIAYLFWALYA